jgi:hypothetical protein
VSQWRRIRPGERVGSICTGIEGGQHGGAHSSKALTILGDLVNEGGWSASWRQLRGIERRVVEKLGSQVRGERKLLPSRGSYLQIDWCRPWRRPIFTVEPDLSPAGWRQSGPMLKIRHNQSGYGIHDQVTQGIEHAVATA